ncbi:lysophospholipid acyltransferase family protein [Sphingorhabdus sp. M41]|uniref:lysophospholipid acyltransferase family protein n=1 Tax=Sphingorhabdus sp. M41 TaxID=1806885 RepID=UPI0012E73B92|nr:lysophospholipid acyltransferase family protein [Sphingorhabdus sp. M41]
MHDEIKPNWLSEIVRRFSVFIFTINGWSAVQENPPPRKAVIIAAPHTSNWDFLYFFGLINKLKIKSYWIGKDTLFKPPWGDMMRRLGGIPVNRSKSQNMVDAMVREFDRRDDFLLTIPPEGTRGSVKEWRTGFYYIALKAKVPLIIGLMDYSKRTGGLGPSFMPTGNYKADMQKLSDFYYSVTPKYPEKAMRDIVSTEPGATSGNHEEGEAS